MIRLIKYIHIWAISYHLDQNPWPKSGAISYLKISFYVISLIHKCKFSIFGRWTVIQYTYNMSKFHNCAASTFWFIRYIKFGFLGFFYRAKTFITYSRLAIFWTLVQTEKHTQGLKCWHIPKGEIQFYTNMLLYNVILCLYGVNMSWKMMIFKVFDVFEEVVQTDKHPYRLK